MVKSFYLKDTENVVFWKNLGCYVIEEKWTALTKTTEKVRRLLKFCNSQMDLRKQQQQQQQQQQHNSMVSGERKL